MEYKAGIRANEAQEAFDGVVVLVVGGPLPPGRDPAVVGGGAPVAANANENEHENNSVFFIQKNHFLF